MDNIRISATLQSELSAIEKDIVDLYDKKGMRASGKFAKELEAKTFNSKFNVKGVLYGAQHTEFLEDGRPAGRVPINFKEILRKWARNKRITFSSSEQEAQFINRVAKNIQAEGWARKDVKLISSVITKQREIKVLEAIGFSATDEAQYVITSEIINKIL